MPDLSIVSETPYEPSELSIVSQVPIASRETQSPSTASILTGAVTKPFRDIGGAFSSGWDLYKQGMEEAGPAIKAGAGSWNPVNPALTLASLKTLGGIAGMAASPLIGLSKTFVGDPTRAVLPESIAGIPVAEPVAQTAEALAGPGIVKTGANALRAVGELSDMAQASRAAKIAPEMREAREVGFKIPPGTAGTLEPGGTGNVLAAIAGKDKTQQKFSFENQKVANKLGARELGLPEDTVLTPGVFERYRKQESSAYEAVKTEQPSLSVDGEYKTAIDRLGGRRSAASSTFPDIAKDAVIKDVRESLLYEKGADGNLVERSSIPTNAAIEKVRDLRSNSRMNFKGADIAGDPGKKALAEAQRDAANALDALIDRNLTQAGKRDVMERYREARANIAKAHELEDATDVTSHNVDPRYLGKRLANGAPLTGNLRVMGNAANLAPKAFQEPPKIGMLNPYSAVHGYMAAGSLPFALTNPKEVAAWLAIVGSSPLARNALLSERMQQRIAPLATPRPRNILLDYLSPP